MYAVLLMDFPKAVIVTLLAPITAKDVSSAPRRFLLGGGQRVKLSLFAMSSLMIVTWLPVSSKPMVRIFLILPDGASAASQMLEAAEVSEAQMELTNPSSSVTVALACWGMLRGHLPTL